MKNIKKILISLSMLALVGCANTGSGAIGGTTLGAAAGAGLGQAIGNDTQSTLIGAAAGAVGGALIGTMQDRNTIEQQKLEEQRIQNQKPQYYQGYSNPQLNQPVYTP